MCFDCLVILFHFGSVKAQYLQLTAWCRLIMKHDILFYGKNEYDTNVVDSAILDVGIVRELVLSTGGDDDMGTLLGMMHSAPPSALQLKAHILKVHIDPKNEICTEKSVCRFLLGCWMLLSLQKEK